MRESGENVASLLRRGYGGQDVEMLPIPIPIVNERKTAMKKMMMAVSFDENGIVTNQCETVRTEYDAL